MCPSLDIETLKQNSLAFVQLLGNDHDTTSTRIIELLATDFAVQHDELPPSEGGRDAFLSKLRDRLKLARGHVSVEVKYVIAEVCQDEYSKKGGQCWVFSKKNTPFGSSDSLDMITFGKDGRITFCQDLHSPKQGRYSSFIKWFVEFVFGVSTHGAYLTRRQS